MTDAEPGDARLPGRLNEPYDAPDAATLIGAVRSYLHDDLLHRAEGPDRWLLRIAANALAVAEREVRLGPEHRLRHSERLASLGVASERGLAEAIRSGHLDHRLSEVLEVVRGTVLDSLKVANPDYVKP